MLKPEDYPFRFFAPKLGRYCWPSGILTASLVLRQPQGPAIPPKLSIFNGFLHQSERNGGCERIQNRHDRTLRVSGFTRFRKPRFQLVETPGQEGCNLFLGAATKSCK